MQKLLLLPAFMFFAYFTCTAQRYADFEITLYEPVAADTLWIGNQFVIEAYVKNNGPDTVQLQDSLAFELLFDGSPISFGNGTTGVFSPYLVLTNRLVPPGDSGRIQFSFTMSQGWDTGVSEICVGVFQLTEVDTLFDTVAANNRSCATVTIMDPLTVTEVGGNNTQITMYPNPVKNELFISSKDRLELVELYNLQGQKLVSKKADAMNTHIETGNLVPGIYILKVNGSYAGRVMKE